MKKSLLSIFSIMMLLNLSAQQEAGIELYFSYAPATPGVGYSSIIYFQSPGNWHAELRHNYDEVGASSINIGRSFSFGNKFLTSVKPMIGLVMGSFTGISLNIDNEVEWDRFYYSSKIQYMFSFRKANENSLYAWLEAGYCFSKKVFAGISLQTNLAIQSERYFNKGFVIGLSFGRLSIPVYFFDPLSHSKNITTGVMYNIKF